MVDSLSPHPENPDSAKQAVRQEMCRTAFSFSGCRRRSDTGICRVFASVGMASYNSIIAIGEMNVKEEGRMSWYSSKRYNNFPIQNEKSRDKILSKAAVSGNERNHLTEGTARILSICKKRNAKKIPSCENSFIGGNSTRMLFREKAGSCCVLLTVIPCCADIHNITGKIP